MEARPCQGLRGYTNQVVLETSVASLSKQTYLGDHLLIANMHPRARKSINTACARQIVKAPASSLHKPYTKKISEDTVPSLP